MIVEFAVVSLAMLIGFALGNALGSHGYTLTSKPSEWERWFRYYLDALGSGNRERAASFADATMEEITKRRKG